MDRKRMFNAKNSLTAVMFFRLHVRCSSVSRLIRTFSTIKKNGLVIEQNNSILRIGINNPSKRNCLNLEIINQLKQAFVDFEKSDAKVAIIYGENGCFSSGFDINEVIEKGYITFEDAVSDWKTTPLCNKPIICALSGFAIAEGFELALACDLRVIEETASMGLLGRRYGVPLSLCGGERLAALAGQSRALDLILTGRRISGNIAAQWGLAARVVATGTAIGQSLSLASSIAKYPLKAVQHDRLEILKSSWSSNPSLRSSYEDEMKILRKASLKDISELLPKFTQGIGKHGEYKNIIKKKLPHWEEETPSEDEEVYKIV